MKREWECGRCGARHDPEDSGFSGWRCDVCKAPRWSRLSRGAGIAAAAILVALVGWSLVGWLLQSDPQEELIARAKGYLKANGGPEGQITPTEMDGLAALSRRLKLSGEMKGLLRRAKAEYLEEKRQTLRHDPPGRGEITPQEIEELCRAAGAMGLRAEVRECAASLQEVVARLVKGEFAEAERLLQGVPAGPDKTRFTSDTPGMAVRFQYQIGAGEPSPLHPLNSPELKALALAHRDNYRLFISVSHNGTYLYVFQRDQYGQISRLFPDPVWSRTDNPLQGGMTYQIPPGNREWLYLDELPPAQGTAIQETLYLVASPWRAEDLDSLYGKIRQATSRPDWEKLVKNFLERLRRRRNTGFKAVYYQEFTFRHEG